MNIDEQKNLWQGADRWHCYWRRPGMLEQLPVPGCYDGLGTEVHMLDKVRDLRQRDIRWDRVEFVLRHIHGEKRVIGAVDNSEVPEVPGPGVYGDGEEFTDSFDLWHVEWENEWSEGEWYPVPGEYRLRPWEDGLRVISWLPVHDRRWWRVKFRLVCVDGETVVVSKEERLRAYRDGRLLRI